MGNMLNAVDENELREQLLQDALDKRGDIEKNQGDLVYDYRPWYEQYKGKVGFHSIGQTAYHVRNLDELKATELDDYYNLRPDERYGPDWILRVSVYNNLKAIKCSFQEKIMHTDSMVRGLLTVTTEFTGPDDDTLVNLMREILHLVFQFQSVTTSRASLLGMNRINIILEDKHPYKLRRIGQLL